MMNVALIGYGYWGQNLLRNLLKNKDCNVSYVVDLDIKRLKIVNELYSLNTTTSYKMILNDEKIDAVVIATPVSSHYELATKALNHNKHVLVEKPMTNSFRKAKQLVKLAKKKQKVLFVDNTYIYTPAVQKIKNLVKSGEIGNIQYIDSTRINLGIFQNDINVLWDLATHDISICLHLMNESPVSVQAIGKSHVDSGIENIAYLTLHYASDKIAHFTCSWISPVKIRHMLIGGTKKMIVFNDLESTEKIKIYNSQFFNKKSKNLTEKFLADYRIGDIYVPKIPLTEGLSNMVSEFINSIKSDKHSVFDVKQSLKIVQILEAAQKSIQNNGKIVKL